MAMRVDGLGIEVKRAASTDALYGERAVTLTALASRELDLPAGLLDTIDMFALRHLEYSRATIRQYAAALSRAVDLAEESGELDAVQVSACRERLMDRPVPRPRSAARRTSAKKRKAVSAVELRVVCNTLRNRNRFGDQLLLKLLINNVTFGLRPCEYNGAKVDEIYLVVQNAKATNGRALSKTREFELEGLRVDQIDSLRGLIKSVEAAANGNIAALIDRLGGRLRRMCKSIGIEPFSLYTSRHQAIANKKASSSAEEVAAFAGHISVHTGRKHYAPASAAWTIDKTAKPSSRMIDAVKAHQPGRAAKPKL